MSRMQRQTSTRKSECRGRGTRGIWGTVWWPGLSTYRIWGAVQGPWYMRNLGYITGATVHDVAPPSPMRRPTRHPFTSHRYTPCPSPTRHPFTSHRYTPCAPHLRDTPSPRTALTTHLNCGPHRNHTGPAANTTPTHDPPTYLPPPHTYSPLTHMYTGTQLYPAPSPV